MQSMKIVFCALLLAHVSFCLPGLLSKAVNTATNNGKTLTGSTLNAGKAVGSGLADAVEGGVTFGTSIVGGGMQMAGAGFESMGSIVHALADAGLKITGQFADTDALAKELLGAILAGMKNLGQGLAAGSAGVDKLSDGSIKIINAIGNSVADSITSAQKTLTKIMNTAAKKLSTKTRKYVEKVQESYYSVVQSYLKHILDLEVLMDRWTDKINSELSTGNIKTVSKTTTKDVSHTDIAVGDDTKVSHGKPAFKLLSKGLNTAIDAQKKLGTAGLNAAMSVKSGVTDAVGGGLSLSTSMMGGGMKMMSAGVKGTGSMIKALANAGLDMTGKVVDTAALAEELMGKIKGGALRNVGQGLAAAGAGIDTLTGGSAKIIAALGGSISESIANAAQTLNTLIEKGNNKLSDTASTYGKKMQESYENALRVYLKKIMDMETYMNKLTDKISKGMTEASEDVIEAAAEVEEGMSEAAAEAAEEMSAALEELEQVADDASSKEPASQENGENLETID